MRAGLGDKQVDLVVISLKVKLCAAIGQDVIIMENQLGNGMMEVKVSEHSCYAIYIQKNDRITSCEFLLLFLQCISFFWGSC